MIRRVLSFAGIVAGGALALATPACAQDLNGAGATFPYPIYDKWFKVYAAKTGVKINYQSIGSGGGVRQFTEGTVDFGASDAPMSDEELAKLKGPGTPHPHGARRRRHHVQRPRVDQALESHRPTGRRNLHRQGVEVERTGNRRAEPGRDASQQGHRRRPPVRRQRHDVHLYGLSHRGESRRGPQARATARTCNGRWALAARATKASPVR